MTDRIPVKAIYTGSDVTSLGELASGDTINGSYITNLGTINNVGSNGQLLSKSASGLAWATVSGGQIVPGGGYASLQVFFSDPNHNQTSHTWTKPANITKIRVFITGAGGGGGYYWGGGGGGGVPMSTSMTHFPRSTGDVRADIEVRFSMLPWPRTPRRWSFGYFTRWNCCPERPSMP